MPQVPIIMPQLGESMAEATIVDIKVKPGDEVAADQEIIEVETNKAVMGVTTPCKGKIDKITAQVKETYPVGTVLGYVEASEEDAARFKKTAPEPRAKTSRRNSRTRRAGSATRPASKRQWPRGNGGKIDRRACRCRRIERRGFLSPRIRARMAELQLNERRSRRHSRNGRG